MRNGAAPPKTTSRPLEAKKTKSMLQWLGLQMREKLRGRARCVAPRASADVASAAWSGRASAVGVKKNLGGLDV